MNFLKGVNRILYIQISGNWIPIGCLTSNSFNEGVDMLETTTRDNTDGWSSTIPTKQSFTLSFDGVMTLTNSSGSVVSYDDLKLIKRNRAKFNWKVQSVEGGNIETGSGHLTSLSEDSSIDDFVTFTGEIQGTGLPISSTLPPTITSKWIEIDDAWVYKGINTNEFSIETGDMIRRYPSLNRYIHARVDSLPYTDENNLKLFEDITVI